jgi:hypothetical protein
MATRNLYRAKIDRASGSRRQRVGDYVEPAGKNQPLEEHQMDPPGAVGRSHPSCSSPRHQAIDQERCESTKGRACLCCARLKPVTAGGQVRRSRSERNCPCCALKRTSSTCSFCAASLRFRSKWKMKPPTPSTNPPVDSPYGVRPCQLWQLLVSSGSWRAPGEPGRGPETWYADVP